MRYLIKNAKIVTDQSISLKKDILIEKGIITKIAKNIVDEKAQIIESKNLHVSIGFCDIGTNIGEPGFEERETIKSVIRSAANGGYTAVAPFPNLNPVVDNKSTIRYIRDAFQNSVITVHPIGAVSKKCEGIDISEMLDMNEHGAVAFSDGHKSIQDTGLLLRALQYSLSINKKIIQHPNEYALSQETMMHEGYTSTSLGLPGNPVESEIIMIKRDIELAKYANAPICIHNISSAESIKFITKERAKGIQISTSVGVMNLIHHDEALKNFDAVYKVQPPLRSLSDKKVLIRSVINDEIQYISSNHKPIDLENKDLEFFRSAIGASTLDTVFASLNNFLGEQMNLSIIVKKLAYGSRQALGLKIPVIEEGQKANLCLFDPSSTWTITSSNILSKSKNNPYIGQTLTGKIIGVMNNNELFLSPTK